MQKGMTERPSAKRKADSGAGHTSTKRPKTKQQWRLQKPRDALNSTGESSTKPTTKEIEPGRAGIWATCAVGREGLCVRELRSLFEDHAEKLYGSSKVTESTSSAAGEGEVDIEAEIQGELSDLRAAQSESLFTSVRLDTQCLVFFQTQDPVEPVSFIRAICEDLDSELTRAHSRFVQRLTPMTLMGKATETGLAKLARDVLAPHFHAPDVTGKKFAIRPNLRNHKVLTRDAVIQQVASIVGPGHKVDLKNYDVLILVEIYKNVCGMSVVGSEYEELKRYNLSELFSARPVGTATRK